MNPGDPKFLHPLPRAYADDFAFAAPSFLSLMPALSLRLWQWTVSLP